MYTQYVHRLSQILQNLQQGKTKKKEATIIQSNSVTMQLDYTAIIPNDRFEKPVDRDDDVTQEESYVVVCVCGRNVFVWGSQLDRQDKNPSQFVCLQRFYFGDSRWAGQCCSSKNLFMKFVIQKNNVYTL